MPFTVSNPVLYTNPHQSEAGSQKTDSPLLSLTSYGADTREQGNSAQSLLDID